MFPHVHRKGLIWFESSAYGKGEHSQDSLSACLGVGHKGKREK